MTEILDPERVVDAKEQQKERSEKKHEKENFAKPKVATFNRVLDSRKSTAEETDVLVDFKSKPQGFDDSQHDTVNNTINKASLGPGIILKNMRDDAKLTKDDVAKELRLAARHIEYLEQDQYDKFTALAFYIGYLRNYSKLLDLDHDKMVAKFYAVYKVMPEVQSNYKKRVVTPNWYDKWPMKLLFGEHKTIAEKNKNIKLLIFSSVLSIIFLCLWWVLSSSSHTTTNPNMVSSNNRTALDIQPDKVDELLPSGPVIVRNSGDGDGKINKNIKVASDSQSKSFKQHKKYNKLDDFS